MPYEGSELLVFKQYRKPESTIYYFYTELESLMENIDRYKNNPEKLSARNLSKHIPSGFSVSAMCLYHHLK